MFKRLLFLTLVFVAAAFGTKAATFTDAGGRIVEIPDRIERVLAAGPPASVLVYVLAPEKLAGWVREPKDSEEKFLKENVRDLPTFGRLTGRGGTANIEMILKAKPDIIIDVGTVNATYISLADKVQAQTGIPYILIDGSFARTGQTLRDVGALLGVTDRAETLADYADRTIHTLNKTLETVPADKRPKVYYGRGPKGLETGLQGSINMEILEAVGATNVAAAAGKGGLSDVSLEQVLAWNPDVILAADKNFLASVGADPFWATISAVKNKKIYKAPDVPFGWFDSPPGVNRLIGVVWLESLIYSDTFKVDMRAETKAFFKLFYQVDISDADVDMLLSGTAK